MKYSYIEECHILLYIWSGKATFLFISLYYRVTPFEKNYTIIELFYFSVNYRGKNRILLEMVLKPSLSLGFKEVFSAFLMRGPTKMLRIGFRKSKIRTEFVGVFVLFASSIDT